MLQPRYWGSPEWLASHNRRTHVEGFFGCLQNTEVGGVDNNTHQHRRLALVTKIHSAAASVSNAHILRSWHSKTGKGDHTHPLLQTDEQFHGFKELTESEARIIDMAASRAIADRDPGQVAS